MKIIEERNLQHVILIHSEICSNVGCHVPEFSSLHIHDLLWYLEQTNFKLYFLKKKLAQAFKEVPFAKVISLSSNGFLFSFLTNSVSKNRGMLRRELKRMTGTTYPATLWPTLPLRVLSLYAWGRHTAQYLRKSNLNFSKSFKNQIFKIYLYIWTMCS